MWKRLSTNMYQKYIEKKGAKFSRAKIFLRLRGNCLDFQTAREGAKNSSAGVGFFKMSQKNRLFCGCPFKNIFYLVLLQLCCDC